MGSFRKEIGEMDTPGFGFGGRGDCGSQRVVSGNTMKVSKDWEVAGGRLGESGL
jgi:hypothetical protein